MKQMATTERPANVGILAMEWYAPQTYVAQTSLEEQDGCGGKYVVGLGQEAMAFVDDREDIGSVLLTACRRLLTGFGVAPADVGRLEVGTETLVDKSKSVKTTLLRLFGEHRDVEGVSSVNACYGGTAALLNACAWVESSAWDGRYAVVVCGDIAVYEPGPARPSGGCGAVALLVGPGAPLALEPARATHAMDVWDFYKPHHSEFAAVDGKLSQACYLRSVDGCWAGLKRKAPAATTLDAFDHCVFHAPYNKLVQKGFARLALGDDVLAGRRDDPPAADWCAAGAAPYENSLADRGLDAALRKASAGAYDAKVAPATLIPKQIGNTYTASVFAGLLSLVADRGDALAGKRVLLFSYGSGSVATMYAFKGREADDAKFALAETRRVADVPARLAARAPCSAAHFARACDVRVERYGKPGYAPTGAAETDGAAPVPLAADAFALAAVDDKHIRSYVAPAN